MENETKTPNEMGAVNQPANQPANQTPTQPVNQTPTQPVNQTPTQPVNQTAYQVEAPQPPKTGGSRVKLIAGIAAAVVVICIAAVIILPRLSGGGVNSVFADAQKCTLETDSINEFDFTYQYPSKYDCVDDEYDHDEQLGYKTYDYETDYGDAELLVAAVDNDTLSETVRDYCDDNTLAEYGIDTDTLIELITSRDTETLAELVTSGTMATYQDEVDSMKNATMESTNNGFQMTVTRNDDVYTSDFTSVGKNEEYALLVETKTYSYDAVVLKVTFADDYMKLMLAELSFYEDGYDDYKTALGQVEYAMQKLK